VKPAVQTLYQRDEPDTETTGPRRRWWHVFREPTYPTRRIAVRSAFTMLLAASAVFGIMCGLMLVYTVNLPQMDELARYRPSTTTELYDIHGKVFGSFALERRVVVPYSEFPEVLRQAIFSIEDKNFEHNSGVNLVRVVGAAYQDLHSKKRGQGASTLTMQLARNLFLSSEKSYSRKVQEIFLTLQIERRFTKPQIFALYANQIYLGRGTYGFEAGSEYYFSKHAHELTLPEAALLAALPKGPEEFSPVRHPERALKRRNLVISEMLADKKITRAQADAAKAAPLGLKLEAPVNTEAPYFVEEVRRQLEREYGAEEAHGAGLRVYTTLDFDLQRVANKAVLDGTAAYERRHGWKGHLPNILSGADTLDSYRHPDWTQPPAEGQYLHALVTDVGPAKMVVKLGTQQTATLTPADWAWTQKTKATDLAQVGDIVYVRVGAGHAPPQLGAGAPSIEAAGSATPDLDKQAKAEIAKDATAEGALHVVLEQDSGTQASMMAVDNSNGEVLAMVGGRDFALSQFNRATQAQRQVGSSFKPYDYTTAIENGMKPTDTVVDAPTSFYTPNGPYTPHNYEPDYKGTMTLIEAFAESRNIPALRLANKYGIAKVIETAHRFGITSNLPNFLPIAIGAADITLAEQVGAYTVFPNDGIRIQPHYIRKVVQADGQPYPEKSPAVSEVISVDTARKMMVLLQAVTSHGTAAATAQMKHAFGGKTGTTNGFTDAWFIGFSPSITCGTWMGFDDRQSLGSKETGAKAALPMWMEFMKAAVADRPNETFSRPDAPKKQLDLPAAGNDDGVPARPAKSDDDADMNDAADDSDAPAKSPDAPKPAAPAPGPPPSAPVAAPPAAAPKASGTPPTQD
jgi:penicillin-binding protein 1A